MPASIELFWKVSKPADQVYLDTNFILNLILFLTDPKKPDLEATKNFYDFLLENKVKMVTSILAISELYYVYMFKLGIEQDMKSFTDSSGKTYSKLPEFKKERKSDYINLFRKYSPRIETINKCITACNFIILYPKILSTSICNEAANIMDSYILDPTDSLHIAIAKHLDITHIVTSDTAFQDVEGITIYTSKLKAA